MVDAPHVLVALKQAIRARRITYRALAGRLAMSESGVKKLFASGDCSIGRVLAICDAIGVSLEDLAREVEAAGGKPAALSPTQAAFFLQNPQCFYYLWELIANNFDPRAVAKIYGLDGHAQERYLIALQAQGCVRVAVNGAICGVNGFRHGVQLPHELAKVLFHSQQVALLERARSERKSADDNDPDSMASLGMARLRLRRDTVIELKKSLRTQAIELEQRSRRDVLTARPEDCIDVGLMTVLAPFKLADLISLARPRIKAVRRRRAA